MLYSDQRMTRRGASCERRREGLLHTHFLPFTNLRLARQTPALRLLLIRAHVVLVCPPKQVCPGRGERGSSCGGIHTCPQGGFFGKWRDKGKEKKRSLARNQSLQELGPFFDYYLA